MYDKELKDVIYKSFINLIEETKIDSKVYISKCKESEFTILVHTCMYYYMIYNYGIHKPWSLLIILSSAVVKSHICNKKKREKL